MKYTVVDKDRNYNIDTDEIILEKASDLQLEILMAIAKEAEHYEYCKDIAEEQSKRKIL